MIERIDQSFLLHTEQTTYAFRVMESGQPEHLYYGRRVTLDADAVRAIGEKRMFAPGNTCIYSPQFPEVSLEDVCLELSAYGKGDIREPFLEIVHADGSTTSDFVFARAEITAGKPEYRTLPGSYGAETEVEHLCVTLRDSAYSMELELHYYVYAAYDVITRSARLINCSQEPIRLLRMMSMQLDFDRSDYVFTTFHGA